MKRRRDYVEISKTTLEHLYYDKGLTQAAIAERFGVNPKTIGNRMVEYGMSTRIAQDYMRLNLPKAELERLYVVENRPAPEVAQVLGCAVSAVYDYLRRYGIPIRATGQDKLKQIIPEDRRAWSREFAYVVGLIASDGNLQADCNEVRITSTDREVIDLYCRCLGLRPDDIPADQWEISDAPPVHMHVTHRPPYKVQYSIIFSDYRYRARLEDLTLTPNKSNTLGPLPIPDQYFQDFLRGEFDGDGCWSSDRRATRRTLLGIFTSGSRAYLEWLQKTIERLAGITNGHISGIDLRYERGAAEQLGRFMYYAPELPCLSRKRAIWEEWMTGHYPPSLIKA